MPSARCLQPRDRATLAQTTALAPPAALADVRLRGGSDVMATSHAVSQQLVEPGIGPAVCAKLLRGKGDQVRVPATWREVHAVFWQHPTVLIAVSSLAWLLSSRLQAPVSLADGAGAWRCRTSTAGAFCPGGSRHAAAA